MGPKENKKRFIRQTIYRLKNKKRYIFRAGESREEAALPLPLPHYYSRTLLMSVAEPQLKKRTSEVLATALASIVFPVPGGP